MPKDWLGSEAEWLVYDALIKLGKKPDIDFVYQSPFMGGRMEKGGIVVDFLMLDPPDLAINPQGEYWHYSQAHSPARDLIAREALAGQGITLIFIDEDDLYQDAMGYVRLALQYQDRSRLGSGS